MDSLNIKGFRGEVEKESELTVDSSEIGTDDNEVDVREVFAGLELDNDEVGYVQVEAVKADLCGMIFFLGFGGAQG
jgi:hypothetical protein